MVLETFLLRFDLLLLLFVRMMGLFATAPIWSNRLVPVQVRVAISAGAAVVISPLFPDPVMPPNLVGLIPLVLRELLVGMAIGFVASLALAAVQFAGMILDMNMGLAMVNVLDPMTQTQMPIMGNFLYILGLLIFFTINGHHMLIEAVMDSYSLVPIGTASVTPELSFRMVEIAANLFVVGLKVAAPVLAALFLTMVALGILNRAVPQMNVFIIGIPIQLAVGVFMVMVVLPLYVTFLQVIFRGMFTDIYGVLRLLGG